MGNLFRNSNDSTVGRSGTKAPVKGDINAVVSNDPVTTSFCQHSYAIAVPQASWLLP
jgi:hypothetical protein